MCWVGYINDFFENMLIDQDIWEILQKILLNSVQRYAMSETIHLIPTLRVSLQLEMNWK